MKQGLSENKLTLEQQIDSFRDNYEVLSKISSGAHGFILEVKNKKDEKMYVAKRVSYDSASLESLTQIERETKALKNLDHPNIVTYHNSFQEIDEDGIHKTYLIMDLIKGKSLSELLLEGKRFDEQELKKASQQISNALEYSHKKGLIHRDVKPSNIILDENGNYILIDYGIVKFVGEKTSTLTRNGVGSAFYMSPEQQKGEEVTPESDIYNLGMTLVALASGKEVDWEIVNKPNEQIRKLNYLSLDFLNSLETMIDENPQKRGYFPFETMRESNDFLTKDKQKIGLLKQKLSKDENKGKFLPTLSFTLGSCAGVGLTILSAVFNEYLGLEINPAYILSSAPAIAVISGSITHYITKEVLKNNKEKKQYRLESKRNPRLLDGSKKLEENSSLMSLISLESQEKKKTKDLVAESLIQSSKSKKIMKTIQDQIYYELKLEKNNYINKNINLNLNDKIKN